MSATVEINIKGIAICYQKQINGKNVWRVLFPFDECHRVKFISPEAAEENFIQLGKPNSIIEITAESAASATGSTPNFESKVFDLTSENTHSQLRVKDGWEERSALLTIENIILDAGDSLEMASGIDAVLTDVTSASEKSLGEIAHNIKGKIELEDNGRIIVTANSTEIFASEPGKSCTLTFDNDCPEIPEKDKNDMELYYRVIEDAANPDRMFLIEGKSRNDGMDSKDFQALTMETGPGFLGSDGDKPCLSAKVTSAENLP